MAVGKAHPVAVLQEAYDAGLRDFGENRAQELAAKHPQLPADIRWHFVGPLQRNKVRLIAGRVAVWQSVDRIELVREIAKRAPGATVLIQVNATGEAQKSGCSPAATQELVEGAVAAGLTVEGLMTVGPTDPQAPVRPAFATVRALADRLALPEVSMGMTRDLEEAVGEGSTMVRIGTALLGPRPVRDPRRPRGSARN